MYPNKSFLRFIAGLVLAASSILQAEENGPEPKKPDAPAAEGKVPADYRLGNEDQVSFWVLGVDEMPKLPVNVDPQGNVDLPLIGQVKLAGLTTEQAKAKLKERYAEYVREPLVTVTVTEFRSQPVSVVGAVTTPGVQQIKGRKTLMEVISMAGGLRTDAGHVIKITRQKEYGQVPLPGATTDAAEGYSVGEVKTESLLHADNPKENIAIMPHDVISIPKAQLFYVMGEVKKTGGFVLGEKESLSVLQAVSMAEGLAPNASASRARILRRSSPTADRVEIAVDVKRILNGKSQDVAVQADDVLFIPSNTTRKISLKALDTALTLGTGILIWRR